MDISLTNCMSISRTIVIVVMVSQHIICYIHGHVVYIVYSFSLKMIHGLLFFYRIDHLLKSILLLVVDLPWGTFLEAVATNAYSSSNSKGGITVDCFSGNCSSLGLKMFT